jgi:hypothetical protein
VRPHQMGRPAGVDGRARLTVTALRARAVARTISPHGNESGGWVRSVSVRCMQSAGQRGRDGMSALRPANGKG